ncbi:MAG: outer membrane protein transport protein [bacterium]|nr:outer membrane protein transport protein [bacterium]
MKRFTSVVVVLCVLTLSTSLFASGVSLTGVGARATALGGNFRGVANDWSAIFWNPAGLTQIKGFHVGASFELVMPGAKYTLGQNVPPFSVYKTEEFENEPRTFPIPAAGFVYGTEKMAFGLAVYAPFGLGSKWDAMNTAAYNSAYPEFEFEDDLQVININPTFSYQVTDKFSVGVGFSFILADIIIRKPSTTPNPLIFDPNLAPLRGMLSQMQLGGLLSSNFNHILTDSELKGNGNNFGFNMGIKYNITDNLSLGLSGIYYNDIALDGEITANTFGATIDAAAFAGYKGILDQMLAGNLVSAAQYQQLLGIYSGQKIPKYNKAKGDATLPLPMTLGAGLAFTGIEKLLIAADVSFTQWSSWDVIEIDMEDGSKSELIEKWDDAIRFGLGMEYSLSDPFKLRAGYYTEPSVIGDETLTIVIPDINRRHVVNLGLSYKLGPLDLFASYEKIFIGDRTVDAPWNYNATALGYDNMAGSYKMNVDNVMFGLGYNF